MRISYIYAVLLTLAAPLAAVAQDNGTNGPGAGTPELKCQATDHTHTTGYNKYGLESEYRRFRVIKTETGVRVVELPAKLNSDGTRVSWPKWVYKNGIWVYVSPWYKVDDVWNEWNVFDEGVTQTNGSGRDHYYVGSFSIRRIAPLGDIMTKGWFGSDEWDNLHLSLPVLRTRHLEYNDWQSREEHVGSASLQHTLYTHTMLKPIGGFWLWDAGFAGSIQPELRNDQFIRNVNDGDRGFGNISYNQEASSVTAFNVSASGSWTAKNGFGAEIGASMGGEFATTNPHLFVTAIAIADVSGPARRRAEAEGRNSMGLGLFANDVVLAWEMIEESNIGELQIYREVESPRTRELAGPETEEVECPQTWEFADPQTEAVDSPQTGMLGDY